MIKDIMSTAEITNMKENLIQLSVQLADSEHHLETIFNYFDPEKLVNLIDMKNKYSEIQKMIKEEENSSLLAP